MFQLTQQQQNKVVSSATLQKNQDLKHAAKHHHRVSFYPYSHDGETLIFGKVRFDTEEGKVIRAFHFGEDGSVLWKIPDDAKPLPLYGLPLSGETVYFVEGEKCADALRGLGLSATTSGGATSLKDVDLSPLQDKHCILWRDKDEAGERWQSTLQSALLPVASSVEAVGVAAVRLPDGQPLPHKGDCADYVAAYRGMGESPETIKARVLALPLETPAADSPNTTGLTEGDNNTFSFLLGKIGQDEPSFHGFIEEFAQSSEFQLETRVRAVAKHFNVSRDYVLRSVALVKDKALFPAIEPYPEPVDGKALFAELWALVDDHMVMDEPLKVAFVLWVVMTYFTDCAQYLPLAWITAPERACGKSTLLSLFERVVKKPIAANSITPAATFRLLEKHQPTLLVDEIDTFLKENKDLLGIVNAGYSRHAPCVYRYDVDEKRERSFNVFSAKVFSGIGEMNETFVSRAIRFELRRKTNDDKAVKRMNLQTLPHEQTELLRQKITRWSQDHAAEVQAAASMVQPMNLDNRAFDNWFILFQVAIALGVYDKALWACQTLNQQQEAKLSVGEQLLWDIRELLKEDKSTHYPDETFVSSTRLHQDLISHEHLRWASYANGQPITPHALANMLKNFGIKAQRKPYIRGYYLKDLQEAFKRYLPPIPT